MVFIRITVENNAIDRFYETRRISILIIHQKHQMRLTFILKKVSRERLTLFDCKKFCGVMQSFLWAKFVVLSKQALARRLSDLEIGKGG